MWGYQFSCFGFLGASELCFLNGVFGTLCSTNSYFFQENWKSSHPLPDMRLLIIEPTVLKEESLRRLQDIGWGLCRVQRLEYLKVFLRKRLTAPNLLNLLHFHTIPPFPYQLSLVIFRLR